MMDASETHEAVAAEVQIATVSIKVLKIGKTGNFLLECVRFQNLRPLGLRVGPRRGVRTATNVIQDNPQRLHPPLPGFRPAGPTFQRRPLQPPGSKALSVAFSASATLAL
jgi:hypothetical protein